MCAVKSTEKPMHMMRLIIEIDSRFTPHSDTLKIARGKALYDKYVALSHEDVLIIQWRIEQ